MHFSTISLAALSATLALANTSKGLGYMHCVTAVVQDLDFPHCTSPSKLDCFCASPYRDTHHLSPQAQRTCFENGVDKHNIPSYLCNDASVPYSPRKGSNPMVRLGDTDTNTKKGSLEARAMKPEPETTETENAQGQIVYEVVTMTRTECVCAKTSERVPAPTSETPAPSSSPCPSSSSARVEEKPTEEPQPPIPVPTHVEAEDQGPPFEGTATRMASGAMMGGVVLLACLMML